MPGEFQVDVFADASAYGDLGVGSWAFRIPSFDIIGTGIERGNHVDRFELAGAVSGIEAAARIDASMRPIRVHTDSQFVMSVLTRLAEATEMPPRRSFDRVRDLVYRFNKT